MTAVLYKYRSLENFKNFLDIILKNRLYAAPYKDLNDPMEGKYYYPQGIFDGSRREKLENDKEKLRICSLSRNNNHELMWSHYANGQRGVAIGVTVSFSEDYTVKPVQYEGLPYYERMNFNNQTAIDILSNKLEVWEYEEEERVFVNNKMYVDVEVKKIITGRAMKKPDFYWLNDLIKRMQLQIEIIPADEIMGPYISKRTRKNKNGTLKM